MSIENRLIKLEVRSEERWKAHDEKSVIVWDEIKDDIKALFHKMDKMIGKKDICMSESRSYVNKIVAISVGVPITIFILLRIFVK